MKYRKKPVIIEAVLLEPTEKSIKEVLSFQGKLKGCDTDNDTFKLYCHHRIDDGFLDIFTLEGTMKASFGDYIIKGINDEFYPCKPDIFHKTYDTV